MFQFERERVTKSDKLEFIAKDISNLIELKKDNEANISTIVKYYALALTSFFAFIVFFISKDLADDGSPKNIFAYLGLYFLIFLLVITYYTSYTISKNLKRRILYRKEIIALRSSANKLMENIYFNNICPLTYKNYNFTNFNSLPMLAILIAMTAPLISYLFLSKLIMSDDNPPKINTDLIETIICISIVIIFKIFLNLYNHHRTEMLIAKYTSVLKNERYIENLLKKIDKRRRKQLLLKNLKKLFRIVLVFFIIGMLISQIIEAHYLIKFFLTVVIICILAIKNRYINFKQIKLLTTVLTKINIYKKKRKQNNDKKL